MASRFTSLKTLSSFRLSSRVNPCYVAYYSNIVGDSPVLVRDFIHAALYDPAYGYFSQRPGSVGVLDGSIRFNKLEGRKSYLKHLDAIYKQSDISWFTPVELFKPWYAHGIAEAIMRTTDLSVPLKIYEIGGGSGACAKGVMDYIKLNAPTRVYNNMTYVSVEISSSLAKKQLETIGAVDSHLARFRVECRDASDPNGWGVEQQPCWVIMLEVLDNLPHDLIYSKNQVSPWMEVWVEKREDSAELRELYKTLEDTLIISCMDILGLEKDGTTHGSLAGSVAKSIWSKVLPRPRRCWLPTGCLKLLQTLHGALKKMSLIASDFSYLPDVRIPGDRAPLVSCKRNGNSSDLNNYLDAKDMLESWRLNNKNTSISCRICFLEFAHRSSFIVLHGDADIFFPTDFRLLENIDHYCSGWLKLREDNRQKKGKKRRTIMLDTSSFMEEFGLPSKTRTKDGYNPLLEDFKNTKFYLSVPTHNTK